MKTALQKKCNSCKEFFYDHGYTLVELLVAMAITLVVMAGVYKVYVTQQDSYLLQEQVAEMQQNARIAKYVLMRDIRMAGYNPTRKLNAGDFVTRFVARLPDDDLAEGDPNWTSTDSNSIAFTLDDNGNGYLDASLDEQIAYRVAGENLQRFNVANNAWLTVVENIEAIGFGYAYDEDNDGNIETCGSDMIWAIDSDGDDLLDLNLDTNGDCKIDVSDDANNDGILDGTAITPAVPIENIRAVRIWVLARSGQEDRRYTDSMTYVLGNKIESPADGSRRLLITTTVKCRNMAL